MYILGFTDDGLVRVQKIVNPLSNEIINLILLI